MPSREVLQLRLDHFSSIVQLRPRHAPFGDIEAGGVVVVVEAFEGFNHLSPVAPAVKVAVVARQHLGDEAEFSGPEGFAAFAGEVERDLLEQPAAVVPDPVAFWVFD